jgi:uncharacterized protein YecE (DUF72 family)
MEDNVSTTAAKAERRARKAQRRETQRAANPLRAQKMRTARLADGAVVQDAHSLPALNIGCSGWFYWGWRGAFYPTQLPTKNWFDFYAEHFDTVELNASFYAWPTVNTVKGWRSHAEASPGGADFVYTVKVNELITHERKFEDVAELIKDFGYIADVLGPSMGCFLFQFPASFHYSPEALSNIVSQLDHSRRNVVEFRHESWWKEEVYAAFRETQTIFCSCSGPNLPDQLITTSEDIYLRLHGVEKWYLYDYSDAELGIWIERIRTSGAKRVWIYFNNDYQGNAIKNANTMARLITARQRVLTVQILDSQLSRLSLSFVWLPPSSSSECRIGVGAPCRLLPKVDILKQVCLKRFQGFPI